MFQNTIIKFLKITQLRRKQQPKPAAILINRTSPARKVSKYGVFSGPHFPVFALNTER